MSSKSDRDNRSNQLNPNNDAYNSSRGTSRSGSDDDDNGTAPTHFHTVDPDMFMQLNGCMPRVETYAFGAVSLNGRAVYRTATFAVPGSSFSKDAARVQFEEYLNNFDPLARATLAKSLGPEELAIFAVFDPTESCLNWHVPLQQDDLQATRASIALGRLAFVSNRLKPEPAPTNLSMLDAISPGAAKKAEQDYRASGAEKLDPLPFIEALREAVTESALCWGEFTVPPDGRMDIAGQREVLKQISGA